MEILGQGMELFLHLDRHLAQAVEAYGVWVYGLLFAIIFVETGLVVMPFLPGDSLLFIAGALAGIGVLDLPTLLLVLFFAAVSGDALNYSIGRRLGARVVSLENRAWFNRDAYERTRGFYQRYGAATIVIARFVPFVRTFAPFVAGIAAMDRGRFAAYNAAGGLIWVGSLTTLGWAFGEQAWVKEHFAWIALAMIVVPGLPVVFELGRHAWRSRALSRKDTLPPSTQE
jgi:membrane-associated protein